MDANNWQPKTRFMLPLVFWICLACSVWIDANNWQRKTRFMLPLVFSPTAGRTQAGGILSQILVSHQFACRTGAKYTWNLSHMQATHSDQRLLSGHVKIGTWTEFIWKVHLFRPFQRFQQTYMKTALVLRVLNYPFMYSIPVTFFFLVMCRRSCRIFGQGRCLCNSQFHSQLWRICWDPNLQD